MEFIEHTIAWCKGEIFEARIILLVGLIAIFCAFLFYKMGNTTYSKAIVLPLLVLGVFYSANGIYMSYSNEKRIVEYSKEYNLDQTKFITQEKQRVENFSKWYQYTRITMTIFITIGLALYFIGGATLSSIGLVLIFTGFSGFVIDHFSEERAKIYYEQINNV